MLSANKILGAQHSISWKKNSEKIIKIPYASYKVGVAIMSKKKNTIKK